MLGITLLGMVAVPVMGATFKCTDVWGTHDKKYHRYVGGKRNSCNPMASALNSMESKVNKHPLKSYGGWGSPICLQPEPLHEEIEFVVVHIAFIKDETN